MQSPGRCGRVPSAKVIWKDACEATKLPFEYGCRVCRRGRRQLKSGQCPGSFSTRLHCCTPGDGYHPGVLKYSQCAQKPRVPPDSFPQLLCLLACVLVKADCEPTELLGHYRGDCWSPADSDRLLTLREGREAWDWGEE